MTAIEKLEKWLEGEDDWGSIPHYVPFGAIREVLADNERLRAQVKALTEECDRRGGYADDEATRADRAEGRIDAALEAVPLFSECAAGHVAAVTRALKGDDE